MLPNVQRTDAADHVPVLADEVRELLAVQPGETIVDATFGAGGHSRLLATDLQGSGKLVAIDRDPTVRSYFDRVKASTRGVQMRFLRGDYAVVLSQLAGNGVRADAVLLDLGLSSMQVDRPERGFSYATDAPLDMRMDPSDELSAAAVLADRDERELETIFRRYGERGTRARSRVESSAVAAKARSSGLVSSSTSSGRRFPLRLASVKGIPQNVCSRPSGSRSITSSSRSRRDFLRHWRCCGPEGGWRSSASTRSKTGSSSGFCASAHEVARARRSSPFACVGASPSPDPDAEAPPTVRPRGRAQSAGELRSFASGDQELMSTIAQSAAGRAGPRTSTPPALRSRRGVVWIVLFAALLAGVVAVNVAVLRLNSSSTRRAASGRSSARTSPACARSSRSRRRPRGSTVWR